MRSTYWLTASLGWLLTASQAFAIDPLPFKDAAEEDRFRALTSELRCVMCQNQSLADSNAQIAHDLRREVLDLMRESPPPRPPSLLRLPRRRARPRRARSSPHRGRLLMERCCP